MSILLGIIALSVLIIVHELGHFIVAKLSDIKVLEFSIFMGPKLFSVKRGETVYSVRAVPLGGFVRMEGEEEASEDERAFNKKPLLTRAAVIAAGPVMNFLVAVITIVAIVSVTGYHTTEIGRVSPGSPAFQAGLRTGDKIIKYGGKRVYHPADISLFVYGTRGAPVDVEVLRNGNIEKTRLVPEKIERNRYLLGFIPKADYGSGSNVVADNAYAETDKDNGFRPGDEIIRLNDVKVSSGKDIRDFMKINKGNPIKVTVLRNGKEHVLTVTPIPSAGEEQYGIGIGFKKGSGGVLPTVKHSLIQAFSIARNVYYSLIWLITGRVSLTQMSGPVGIVSTIGDVVEQSPTILDKLINLLSMLSFIGINLGIFNLIPFPALDGSKILLIAIEGIRKKAIPPEKEAFISFIGFVLLILLAIFTTYNDIFRQVTGG
ncbi:MAG TPA: RIP metalloprotease RseP [Clostridiaceae bacterium]|nr:RIP metalloprotease RseP [Clostridiaceae bacterium]